MIRKRGTCPSTSSLARRTFRRCHEWVRASIGAMLRRCHRAVAEAEQLANRQGPELAGAKILIVDDDIRNIFSLTSVLESFGAIVLHAERGRDGIRILESTPGIDIA